jgi:sialidase-1
MDLEQVEQEDLFVSRAGGYHTYRIPALAVSARGTLLAFCEGRRNNRSDVGEIDLLLRRLPAPRAHDGTNAGSAWGETSLVVSEPGTTCGNPAPVVDDETGTIWLLFNKNAADTTMAQLRSGESPRTVWETHSADDGLTWSDPCDITAQTKDPGWSWYATGPCHGIQLSSGRLLIPCDHRVGEKTLSAGANERLKDEGRHSHVILSDDHGATWRIGGVVAKEGTNECAATETVGGVYLTCRDQAKGGRRWVARSLDGGETFAEGGFDETLIEPACQGSVVSVPLADGESGVLHCNPASATRDTMTVRLSRDGARTWTTGKVLHAGPAAYSDLAVPASTAVPGLVGAEPIVYCLYERGETLPYERLTLTRFPLSWLDT